MPQSSETSGMAGYNKTQTFSACVQDGDEEEENGGGKEEGGGGKVESRDGGGGMGQLPNFHFRLYQAFEIVWMVGKCSL